ncbi:MAG: hypothetical protein RLZZ618_807 [Pseudomonadota bacterium]|jgi:hypothetical protein
MNTRFSRSHPIRAAACLSRSLFGALFTTLVLAVNSASAAERPRNTSSVQRLPRPAFDALAAKAEAKLRERVKEPMFIEFDRAQSFRFGPAADSTQLLSLSWTPRNGGGTHCVIHLARGKQLLAVDVLEPDLDMPWTCDDPPAVKIVDVDGDGCLDVLAIYPFRPPSNERFPLPIVLTCTLDGKNHQLDVERTNWLRTPTGKHPTDTLAQALRSLDRFRAVPTH